MIKRLLFLTTLLFTITSYLFGGTTGKLTGKIIDAENGEILPGINILIDGTTMGDATDINGEFLINNNQIFVDIYRIKSQDFISLIS